MEALAEVPEEEVEDGSGMENGNETAGTESTSVEERLRKLTMNKYGSHYIFSLNVFNFCVYVFSSDL